jgi:hypothetical protein
MEDPSCWDEGCHRTLGISSLSPPSSEIRTPLVRVRPVRRHGDWRIGTARASNLTPDAETGLGTWSDAEIVRALRNGQRKDGRLPVPVMP